MRESKIESKISKMATQYGIANYKFTSPGSIGVPDRIFITQIGVFFIEFKAPQKPLAPAQMLRIKEMRNSGAIVVVIDTIEAGERMLGTIMESIQVTGKSLNDSVCSPGTQVALKCN